jgi:hypothetical protein
MGIGIREGEAPSERLVDGGSHGGSPSREEFGPLLGVAGEYHAILAGLTPPATDPHLLWSHEPDPAWFTVYGSGGGGSGRPSTKATMAKNADGYG